MAIPSQWPILVMLYNYLSNVNNQRTLIKIYFYLQNGGNGQFKLQEEVANYVLTCLCLISF